MSKVPQNVPVKAAVIDAALVKGSLPDEPLTERGKLLGTILESYECNLPIYVCDVLCDVFLALSPGGHALVSALPATADLTGLGLRAAGFEVRDVLSVFSANGRVDWFLGRRPLGGTVAANVLSHGTGALNIDGGRISYVSGRDKESNVSRPGRGNQSGNHAKDFPHQSEDWGNWEGGKGRFPTHTTFTHHPSCEPCGTKKVKAAQGERRETGKGATPIVTGTRDTGLLIGYGDEDGTETVQAYSCAAYCPTCNHGFTAESGSAAICSCGAQAEWVCPVAALDFSTLGRVHSAGHARTADHSSEYDASSYDMSGKRQMNRYPVTGDNPSRFMHTFHYYTKASRAEREKYVTIEPDAPILHIKRRLEASGRVPRPEFKASFDALVEKAMARPRNDHSTLKPIELMKWLVRLIGCQKGSVILDPFMGSGTTGIAAVTEGFKFIGIEQNARFVEIAHQRISKARPGQEVEHYLQGMVPLFGR